MAIILGIESTCDETAAAVVVDGFDVRSNVVASQVELHSRYRGVVPEIASRAHIENILPVLREATDFLPPHEPPVLPPLPPGEVSGISDCPRSGRGEGERQAPTSSQQSLNLKSQISDLKSEISNAQLNQGSRLSIPLTPALSRSAGSVQARRERGQNAGLSQIDAIAVAYRPGLIGSLLIGVTAAKTLAWALGKPLIGVDHVHAHLYSVVLESNQQPPMPAVGLVCSGGHTALYHVKNWFDVTLIGSTIDDAVGEAYDKVAAILNLGYPGGPVIDRLAATGDPAAIKFPRTLLDRDSLDFSFSGLKTAVLYHVRGVPRRGEHVKSEPTPQLSTGELANIAAGFQAACIDVIAEKLRRAVAKVGARSVIVGGGVSANQGLRAAMKRFGLPVFFPPMRYCTDNAAMSAGLAQIYYDRGAFSDLSLDAITFSQFIAGTPNPTAYVIHAMPLTTRRGRNGR